MPRSPSSTTAQPKHEVHVRFAEYGGAIYIDLADEEWRAKRIHSSGWRVVYDPPVKFTQLEGMLPLPDAGVNPGS